MATPLKDLLGWVVYGINNKEVREELSEELSSAYPYLSKQDRLEIIDILYDHNISEQMKRASILGICNR